MNPVIRQIVPNGEGGLYALDELGNLYHLDSATETWSRVAPIIVSQL